MQDLQKKVYHKNRFAAPAHTPKIAPQDSPFAGIFAQITARFELENAFVELGQLVVFVNPEQIVGILEFLKDSSFEFLSDLSAIHLPEDRFELFYQLLSLEKRQRIRVKTRVDSAVESVTQIFGNALWAEREAFDMLGVRFLNHPHLKRILMPDDWSGHPLRKDYPLQGDEKAQWYEVDRIFGREHREVIGAENRNPSFVNPNDTMNFSHLGFEVPRGAAPSDEPREISYQEKNGVFVVTRFDSKKQKTLDKRR